MQDLKLMVRIHPECSNENPILNPAKPGDVGYDLKAWIKNDILIINPQEMVNIHTGVYIKLPENYWGGIRPRSSTFAKRKLFVMNGTIDSEYVGQLSIYVWNPTLELCQVHNGDRLAQLIIYPRIIPFIDVVENLPNTVRGNSGFGSTDINP